MNRKITPLLAILLFPLFSHGQADISQSTSWYNRAGYNPATITRDDYFYLFANVRQQWIGVPGAPSTINLQGSEYSHDRHSALGFSVTADKIGLTQSLNAIGTYAYRINYNRYRWFSMGLSAGIFLRTYNSSGYEAETEIDPSIDYTATALFRPDVNIGFEYQTKNYIGALSVTHLPSLGHTDSLFSISSHRYLSLIYKNSDQKLFNYFAGLQLVNRQHLFIVEGSFCVRIKYQTGLVSGPREIFEFGAIFRTSRQLTVISGINFTPDLKVGYAFNQSLIQGYYPNNSHEIMIEYRIPKKKAFSGIYRDRGFWYN